MKTYRRCVGVLLVSLGFFHLAFAEGRCPPGYFPTGGGTAGWAGCAPMGPMSSGPSPDDRPRPPPYDPMAARIKVASDLFELVAANAGKVDKLTRDPRFQRYHDGGWDFFPEPKPGVPAAPLGEFCGAFYWRKQGLILVSGPGGEYRGGMLTFWSEEIPRPTQPQTIQVTLTQSGGAPQTVRAFNYVNPGHSFGAISLAVPSIEALLANMKDVLHFELAMAGKVVANVEWRGGLAARDKLSQCVYAAGKPAASSKTSGGVTP